MKKTTLTKLIAFIIAFMLLFTFVACNKNKTNSEIVDREGKSITLPEKVDRIISMAPSITKTLVHLGIGDKIVGCDAYSAGIEGLPSDIIKDFDIMSPATEKIASLSPDIVFATGMSVVGDADPFKPLKDLGIIVTFIPSSTSIAAIKEDIRFIGKATKMDAKVEPIIKEMEDTINKIITTIGENKCNTNVYFEIAPSPNPFSFGKNTFLNEIIELLGAKNIYGDQEQPWVAVSAESLLSKNPDVIFTNVNYIDNPIEEIKARAGFDVISAVANNKIYQIDTNSSSQANEFITIAMLQMAKLLYPNLTFA